MSTLAQTRLANLTSLGSESRNQVSKMAESTEHWMQLARTASVEQDSRKQNDLPTDLILRLEEKGDQLNSPSDFDEVDKPRLAIYKQTAGIPIVGGCSACKDVVFDGRFVAGAAGERREKLENMFQEHCRGVHQSNDGLLKEKGRFGQALMNLQP